MFEFNLDHFIEEPNEVECLRMVNHSLKSSPQAKEHDSLHARREHFNLYINRLISQIDQLVNEQLNAIIHHKKFQKLEGTWRSLYYLIIDNPPYAKIKIRILDVSWQEITRDIDRAIEFDQSGLFKKIYSNEFDMPGGEPYGMILADFEISHRPNKDHPFDDIPTLRGLAQIGAASFCPIILGASAALFGLDNFSELAPHIDVNGIFREAEYIKWNAFREESDSRFIGITMPRFLLRTPYENYSLNHKAHFIFDERPTHIEDYLWGNACFALGKIILREFRSVNWFSQIRGIPLEPSNSGGLINPPAMHIYRSLGRISDIKIATDVVISDMRERELSPLGFIPLCQTFDSKWLAFYSNHSAHMPPHFNDKASSLNATISAMLQNIMCASRIAHYLKVMIRDKVGSFTSAEELERFLYTWLQDYTVSGDDISLQLQAKYPLRGAQVQIREMPGKPGHYSSIIRLQPHYQVDQLVSEIQLTSELSA